MTKYCLKVIKINTFTYQQISLRHTIKTTFFTVLFTQFEVTYLSFEGSSALIKTVAGHNQIFEYLKINIGLAYGSLQSVHQPTLINFSLAFDQYIMCTAQLPQRHTQAKKYYTLYIFWCVLFINGVTHILLEIKSEKQST